MENITATGSYKNTSAFELRLRFLVGAIDEDLMGLHEYEKLFDYEIDLKNPDGDVLTFCCSGLNRYEPYNRDISTIPLEKILERAVNEQHNS